MPLKLVSNFTSLISSETVEMSALDWPQWISALNWNLYNIWRKF